MAKLLMERGAKSSAKARAPARYAGATPLHLAADGENLPVIRELIANAADVNARKADGLTPLMVAILAGHDKATSLLIDAGARFEPKDVKGTFEERRSYEGRVTLLHIIAGNFSENSLRVAELLIAAGADVNAHTKKNGRTPLIYAVIGDTFYRGTTIAKKMIALLVEKGADPNRRAQDGNSALDIAQNQAKWAIPVLRGEQPTEAPPPSPVASQPTKPSTPATSSIQPQRSPLSDKKPRSANGFWRKLIYGPTEE
jgi:ankyrin repeat protein